MSSTSPSAAASREIRILPDAAAIARRAAQELLQVAAAAVAARGIFTVALAGGSTPKALYTLLADDAQLRAQFPWSYTQFFFGDERSVPPDDPDSNYRMASEAMLSKAPIKPDQVKRISGEFKDLDQAALEYEKILQSYFKLSSGQLPKFDVLLLGMGEEGHTLSLFPGTKALHDNGRLVLRNWVGKLYTNRVTITAPVANNSNLVIFMITRSDKALALKAVLEGPHEPEQLPAQFIQPTAGRLLWLIDHDAAQKLSTGIGIRE
jgi:6-phosphogluconolactonase